MLPFSPEQSIPERFARVVEIYGVRTAILTRNRAMTYAEFDASANRISHRLLELDANRQSRVGVLARHDLALFPGVLAALKVGKVVVVLNPTDPPARHRDVLRHAEASVLLTDSINCDAGAKLAREMGIQACNTEDPALSMQSPKNPGLVIPPTDLAFLIFTSGSTGKPKAVMQPHRNLIHNALRFTVGLHVTPEDRILSLASLSGGQGVGTTWQTLLNGAALVPFPAMEKGVNGLADLINRQKVTIYISAASLFRHFIQTLTPDDQFPSVRLVRLASESAPSDALKSFKAHFRSDAQFFHTLSSSETGNVTQHAMSHDTPLPDGKIPVGQPSSDMEVLLLNESRMPVAVGEVGEIHVRSHYLSPGYWRDDALTKERFSTDPDGRRRFHMGDVGWFAHDVLHYVGRKDHQVKVRGFRVELSEVEGALHQLPQVAQAVVIARPAAEAGTVQLVAYLTLRPGVSAASEQLREALREKVGRHMIPSAFVILDKLPMNAHGKIDRARLPAPAETPTELSEDQLPQTPTEEALAAIWESVFHRAIARAANFFDLGGDSLSAAVIAARVHTSLQADLDFHVFTGHPTLHALAAEIDQRQNAAQAEASPIIPIPRGTPLPLSFPQERTFRGSKPGTQDGYKVATMYRLKGPLRADLFHQCLESVVQGIENFRTTFETRDGKPVQIIHAATPLPLPLIDLADTPDAEGRVQEIFRERAAAESFDISVLPLARFFLVRLSPDEHRLIRVSHHIISDGWSWGLLVRELGRSYAALLQGQHIPAPAEPPLQFADYAVWQRRAMDRATPAYQAEVDWWHKHLAGSRTAKLPFRRTRLHRAWLQLTRAPKPGAGLIWWGLPPATSATLHALGRDLAITPFNVRVAIFVALLAHQSRQRDFTLGTYVTNRTRVETQSMFGFFSHLVHLRFRPDFSLTLEQWLRTVQATVLDAQAHAEIPSDLLVEDLRARGLQPPKIRAVFTVTDHVAPQRFAGIDFSWMDRKFERTPWQFTLGFDRHYEGTRNRATFNPYINDRKGVQRFLDDYINTLSRATKASLLLRDLFG